MKPQKELRNTVACRIFFKELLQSNLFVNTDGSSVLVTPTGASCNKLFGVGVVKEAEKRGKITKIKISDMTATLNIYTAKAFHVESGVFLAFVAKLHVRANTGKGILMIVEEAAPVAEYVRDTEILTTAKRTMERVELLRNLTLTKNELSNGVVHAENVLREPVKHYAIDDDKLDALAEMAINAVKGVWQHHSKTTKKLVLDVLGKAGNSSMDRMELTGELEKRGLLEEWIEETIEELIEEGRCYEPEAGAVKVV
ncbi:MAG: hypothetical protein C5S38_01660 [Candidatus Methanophagaceae archaeon]|nr:MAG: hypothetical protein C5S38_01630 [Methanophagales archaeon]KAF5417490.1 MAG: hypothetical protein C5S38_01660 [Methanophagales archaeon]